MRSAVTDTSHLFAGLSTVQAPRFSPTCILKEALSNIPVATERSAPCQFVASPFSCTRTPSRHGNLFLSQAHVLDYTPLLGSQGNTITLAHPDESYIVIRLSLGKPLVNLLQVVKRTNTPLIP